MAEDSGGPLTEPAAKERRRIARAPEDIARAPERTPDQHGVVPLREREGATTAPGVTEAPPDPERTIDPNELDLPPPPPPRRHRLAGALSVAALAIAAFITGLFLFNNLVMPRFIHVNAEVRVPDLTNLTVDQAEKQVSALHLQLSRAGERFDPAVPSGFILSQDPAEGTPVRGKRRVMVVVSLGEEFSSVPGLFGESVRGARLLIDRAGLRAGGMTHAPSDEVGEGLVVASDPPAETVLPRATPVSFLVSSGAGREEYVMPELLGREISGVRRQLEAIGFRVVTPAGAPNVGGIVFQDPAPGSRITRDKVISLQAMGRLIR